MDKKSKIFSENLKYLRGNKSQREFSEELGLKQPTYSRYESGQVPSFSDLSELAAKLNIAPAEKLLAPIQPSPTYAYPPNTTGIVLRDRPGRFVPVVSVAQAGEIQGRGYFEDIANQSNDQVATQSSDPNAFAVEITGDSMEPEFHARDWIILEPNREPRNGDAVLVKTKEGKVFFKWFIRTGPEGSIIKLESENPDYSTMEFDVTEVEWVYPALESTRRIIPRRTRKL